MVHHSSSALCSVEGCGSRQGGEDLYIMTTLQPSGLGKQICLFERKHTLEQGWRSWAPALPGWRMDHVLPVLCSAKLIIHILL